MALSDHQFPVFYEEKKTLMHYNLKLFSLKSSLTKANITCKCYKRSRFPANYFNKLHISVSMNTRTKTVIVAVLTITISDKCLSVTLRSSIDILEATVCFQDCLLNSSVLEERVASRLNFSVLQKSKSHLFFSFLHIYMSNFL